MPVNTTGTDRLARALEAVEIEATDRTVHRAAAELLLDAARPLAPKGPTGKLQRSGRASGTKQAGVVRFGGPTVPWAPPVHFGHAPPRPQGGYIRPNPFAYVAGDRRAGEIVAVFSKRVDRVLRQQGL